MPVLLRKCTTRIVLSIPFLYQKRIMIRGYVSIIQILIRHARKIPLAYPESIRLWTPQLVVAFQVSLIIILVIIRLPSKKKTESRHPSSLHSVLFVTQQFLSDTKVQGCWRS
jgi:hypothetical protein